MVFAYYVPLCAYVTETQQKQHITMKHLFQQYT